MNLNSRHCLENKRRKIAGWGLVLAGAVGLVMGVAVFNTRTEWGQQSGIFLVALSFCSITTAGWVLAGRLPLSDIRELSTLAAAFDRILPSSDRNKRTGITATGWQTILIERLNSVSSDEFDNLNPQHLIRLRGLLDPFNARANPYLAAAAIRAVDKVGAADFDVEVGRLIGEDVMEPARGTARRCLPYLRRCTAAARAEGNLVRPSHCPEELDGSLLRPVTGQSGSSSDSLLRATAGMTEINYGEPM
jgi:hypothetical protein